MQLPAVRQGRGIEDNETPEQFADMVYGVTVKYSPGMAPGDCYVISIDCLSRGKCWISGYAATQSACHSPRDAHRYSTLVGERIGDFAAIEITTGERRVSRRGRLVAKACGEWKEHTEAVPERLGVSQLCTRNLH
jgi:hypothetical protein